MPELPAGLDRGTLVVVRPKEIPAGTEPDKVPEHVVGAGWLQASPEDFEFVRFDGESAEQAEAREKAAAAAAAPAKTTPPEGQRRAADAFN